jgi:hypothetical protein
MHDDEVPQAFAVADVRDGREGHLGQRLVGPLDALGGEAQLFGRLHQAEQARPDPVGAGQVAHLLQADGPTVVQRDGGQGGGAAVALVYLADTSVTSEHG